MSSFLRMSMIAIAVATDVAACSSTAEPHRPEELPLGPDAGTRPRPRSDASLDAGATTPGNPPRIDAGPSAIVPPINRLAELIVAETPPPAISGGTLAVSADGRTVVAADSDRDLVYIIDPELGAFRVVQLEAGSEPGRVALDDQGQAHVALRSRAALARIDLQRAEVVQTTDVCSHPRGVAVDPVRGSVLVACADGQLVSLHAGDHAEQARSSFGRDLRDVLVSPSGERYLSRYRSAELMRVDADGKVLSRAAPPAIAESHFVLGLLTRLEPAPNAVTSDTSATGVILQGVSPPPQGLPVTVTMSPTLASRALLGADGTPLVLHQQSQEDAIELGEADGYGADDCSVITHGAITQFDADGAATVSRSVTGAGLLVDVAQSPDGRLLAFAQPGAYLLNRGSLLIVEADELTVPIEAADFAAANGGVTPEPSCQSRFATSRGEQTTAVAYDASGRLYTFSREPAQLSVFDALPDGAKPHTLKPSKVIALSDRSVRDTGHDLFHADVGMGLACTSCHGEAVDDGHVWNFAGFGPRRTQGLRGGVLATMPLHWEGDLPNFGALVQEVMHRRMGGITIKDTHGEALAQWLDQLPVLRVPASDGLDHALSIALGKTLFEGEASCARCHSGPALTDNQTTDVGTGGAFQVPSLRGLALRAPYMHDGCAATLADRFDATCGGTDHGSIAQLTSSQVNNLVDYLETL
jgi:hypothetical protein